MKKFDPNHARCLFPNYGLIVDTAMKAQGFSAEDVAKQLGIDASAVRGYRRGFARNASKRTAELEKILGVTLDMSEPTPSSKVVKPLIQSSDAPIDPVLSHLAEIALAHGYTATFAPVSA